MINDCHKVIIEYCFIRITQSKTIYGSTDNKFPSVSISEFFTRVVDILFPSLPNTLEQQQYLPEVNSSLTLIY